MIIDTFDRFQIFWKKYKNKNIASQIQGWQVYYLNKWPELLEKQMVSYKEDKLDWATVAKKRVFPMLSKRMVEVRKAHSLVIKELPTAIQKAKNKLNFRKKIIGVVYVGIGCGAGWATTYNGNLAVLMGLENIVDCRWFQKKSIRGLIYHEIGHLYHDHLMNMGKKHPKNDAYQTLYQEGFAQRIEHIIQGKETWHESMGINPPNWKRWCEENISLIAKYFVKNQNDIVKLRKLFGHWYNYKGMKQCGYYLGHEVIKQLQLKGKPIDEIGKMQNAEDEIRDIVEGIANPKRYK